MDGFDGEEWRLTGTELGYVLCRAEQLLEGDPDQRPDAAIVRAFRELRGRDPKRLLEALGDGEWFFRPAREPERDFSVRRAGKATVVINANPPLGPCRAFSGPVAR